MLLFLALLIVVPMVEIYVIIQVGHAIGAVDTLGLLILLSVFGAWLTKHAGFVVLSRLRAQLDAGRTPTRELIDGVLVLAAGVLIVIPGFVTDAIGLLVLFPPTRAVLRAFLRRRFELRVLGRPGGPGRPGPQGPYRPGPGGDVIDI
ncbi:MAG: protein FxsA [Actinomycetota bacterium]|nr:protein FxsA [Actinomycetota bacterium]